MCQTTISGVDDMHEITSTCHKKPGKLIEPRKIRKPLMEKKRRARINQSLDELKRIVVDAEKLAGQDLSRVNKLEKADILEMTVRYLKRNKGTTTAGAAAAAPASGTDVYLAGYRQCVEQVRDLLAEQWTDGRRLQSGRRMVEHLEVCARRLNVPPQNDRSSSCSSDESVTADADAAAAVAAGDPSHSTTTSSDDDGSVVYDEPNVSTVRPPPDRTTELRNATPKSAWRPW